MTEKDYIRAMRALQRLLEASEEVLSDNPYARASDRRKALKALDRAANEAREFKFVDIQKIGNEQTTGGCCDVRGDI